MFILVSKCTHPVILVLSSQNEQLLLHIRCIIMYIIQVDLWCADWTTVIAWYSYRKIVWFIIIKFYSSINWSDGFAAHARAANAIACAIPDQFSSWFSARREPFASISTSYNSTVSWECIIAETVSLRLLLWVCLDVKLKSKLLRYRSRSDVDRIEDSAFA